MFVVAPLLRAATPDVPPAGTPSRAVVATFQAKMVAPTSSAACLLLRLPTLTKEGHLREEDGGKDGEMDGEIDG